MKPKLKTFLINNNDFDSSMLSANGSEILGVYSPKHSKHLKSKRMPALKNFKLISMKWIL